MPRTGRPPMADGVRRDVRTLRFSDKEWALFERAARKRGMERTAWIRMIAVEAAHEEGSK